ncbi:MAG: chemotaxis protein CheA [Comamonadaceae bacterium]|uniref:Chemotaxis protein CheA n=1 Tax=Hydrogenophaga borbori TaxID=2294117 RepID=A0A372EM57_9BURK|nr:MULTISPECIES: chemotaxis protein CheW [Hydrogenophaga]NCT99764.1 chemotaxis protein CheA [Comamonadaceae bacterium]RFP80472.1 chemotaxis protein CheA [Hydrogenophaga borbori]WQB84441.1 chemotaxis protein CheW [Hydrogenophaga sp. SNF1]
MGDMMNEGQHLGNDIDLSQFYQIFFEEAGENLDQMEQMLLALDVNAAQDEELNAIFRCAHSIKGGAATFGFADVAELTHQAESLLDKLRRHELQPTTAMVDVLLESSDALRGQLGAHQGVGSPPDTGNLVARIYALAQGQDAPAATAPVAAPAPVLAAPAPAPAPAAAAPASKAEREIDIHIGPIDNPAQADGIAELFRDIPGLGTVSAMPCDQPGKRVFRARTAASDNELLDLFTFHVSKEQIQIHPAGDVVHGKVPMPPATEGKDYGFFEGSPGLPGAPSAHASAAAARDTRAAEARASAAAPAAAGGAGLESSTLRVSVSKVDQLINLVGELVITQAMLAQKSRELDNNNANNPLLAGLADLDRNTRDLQEAVMSIRMIPMSVVFNRFPRMLRDLASKLGKKVELVTQGESTELDKGLVEKITDPLTHLIRNSCDHGIEMPEERRAKGKSETGTITLSATHQGGSILIEVRDDGKGLSREKLLTKAREKGIDAPDSLSDPEVWSLIFAPGFSTADQVTDVSGRGVGMDVVKKNITALGGTVEIDSAEGYGMRVSVRLPLTLAIMDGMSVRVSDEVYILPLASVIESFQIKPTDINTMGQNARVVKVREEYMPVVELEQIFSVPRFEHNAASPIMVVVEAEGQRVSLMVDELLGQQQVVIKNLESNYRKVPNVSGATILGDGKVALILDTSSLVRRSRH